MESNLDMFVDGVVARKFNQTSDLGGYLDLISDFIVCMLTSSALVNDAFINSHLRLHHPDRIDLWTSIEAWNNLVPPALARCVDSAGNLRW